MPPKENQGDERLEAEEADFETSKGVNVVNTFDQMKLKEELLRGIYAYGTPPRPFPPPHGTPDSPLQRCQRATPPPPPPTLLPPPLPTSALIIPSLASRGDVARRSALWAADAHLSCGGRQGWWRQWGARQISGISVWGTDGGLLDSVVERGVHVGHASGYPL